MGKKKDRKKALARVEERTRGYSDERLIEMASAFAGLTMTGGLGRVIDRETGRDVTGAMVRSVLAEVERRGLEGAVAHRFAGVLSDWLERETAALAETLAVAAHDPPTMQA